MNKRTCLLAAIIGAWATVIQAEEIPLYQKKGYTLRELTDAERVEVLVPLSLNNEFRRLRGLTQTCETIYQLTDPEEQGVGYGSICETAPSDKKSFLCWTAQAQHLGYATKPYGAAPEWIGDSILHGCGGVLVRTSDNSGTFVEDEMDEWTMPELGWGETRPFLSMLSSDIKQNGFAIPLGACEKIRYTTLGPERNTAYGAICKIDEADKKALICLDNLVGHFGLFTRYKDESEWVEHTIYRHCWGG